MTGPEFCKLVAERLSLGSKRTVEAIDVARSLDDARAFPGAVCWISGANAYIIYDKESGVSTVSRPSLGTYNHETGATT